jgi:predicted dehydrogenase
MLRVGIVGIGFMGMIHYLSWRKVRGAAVRAIVSRDPKKRAGDWRGIQGNFGPPGEQMDLGKIHCYARLEELLADPEIDLVDICLPPAEHARAAIAALGAGKHVLCEKPLALTSAEARRMVAAADRAKRFLLVAHVLPFLSEYAFAYETVRSGKYGRLLGGAFKRVIAEPTWLPDFFDPRVAGGPMLDLHVHDAHFIRLLAGMPKSVFASGRMRGEVAEYFSSSFQFDDPTVQITATSGVTRQPGRSFTHGYEIHLERATLLFDFAIINREPVTAIPVTVLSADGKVSRPKLRGGDPVESFIKELAAAARVIDSGESCPTLSAELAADSLAICEAETRSLVRGRIARVGQRSVLSGAH